MEKGKGFPILLISQRHPELVSGSQRKSAFTLAEVLITLGIIGVIAAMTIPTLIANHRKMVTVTKLKKFYSVMNQAIKLSEVEYGDAKDWMPEKVELVEDGNFEDWYLKYLDKNISSVYKGYDEDNYHYNVAFSDGTGFNGYVARNARHVWIFYCLDFKKCNAESYNGKDTFLFSIVNGSMHASSEAYVSYSRASLLSGCSNSNPLYRHACTALIQHDGWEIKPDYPWFKN